MMTTPDLSVVLLATLAVFVWLATGYSRPFINTTPSLQLMFRVAVELLESVTPDLMPRFLMVARIS